MSGTLLSAAITVIFFIISQVSEGHWKWGEDHNLEYTSAFFTGRDGLLTLTDLIYLLTCSYLKFSIYLKWFFLFCFVGVYGMWNLYVIALLSLYAPSHKRKPLHDTGKLIRSNIIPFMTHQMETRDQMNARCLRVYAGYKIHSRTFYIETIF